jgi:hypothetical protein
LHTANFSLADAANGDLGVLAVRLNGTVAGTTHDQVAVTGTVDITGASLQVTAGYAPLVGDSYTIVSNDAADAVVGTFRVNSVAVPEGGKFAAGGVTFQITYGGGTNGNDIVLTATSTPAVTGTLSRRIHGGAGTFSLPLNADPKNPSTEPRQGPVQSIVFTFNKPVVSGNAAVAEGIATAGAPTFAGNEMTVPLTGVANAQYVTVAVSNVTGADTTTGGAGSIRVGFLAGDVSQNRVVTVSDLAQVNAQLAKVVTAANYLKDVNANGLLTVADKAITNGKLTTSLPGP